MAREGYSFRSSSFASACRRSIWRQPSPYAHLQDRIKNWRGGAHRQCLRPASHGDVEVSRIQSAGVKNDRYFSLQSFEQQRTADSASSAGACQLGGSAHVSEKRRRGTTIPLFHRKAEVP